MSSAAMRTSSKVYTAPGPSVCISGVSSAQLRFFVSGSTATFSPKGGASMRVSRRLDTPSRQLMILEKVGSLVIVLR
jgi:hypothetical protein